MAETKSPDIALRDALVACGRGGNLAMDRELALTALRELIEWLTTAGRLPNGQDVVVRLIADGYCVSGRE